MAYAYPSGTNSWIPSWEATGQTIAFIRDPKRFAINNYIDFRPATKPVGLYLEFDLDYGPRVQPGLGSYVWNDGGERPSWEGNRAGFEFKEYRTIRRDNGFVLGEQSIENAAWPIVAFHSAGVMQQSMTALAADIIAHLEDSGNWGSGNYDTAENILDGVPGGSSGTYLDVANATVGDAQYLNIKKVFNAVMVRLQKNTGGMVAVDEYWAVLSPGGAAALAQTAEIQDTIKQSPFAMMQVRGEIGGRNALYGLPDQLYGFNLCVDNTVSISANKGATQTRSFAKSDDTIFFLSKPKALPGDQVGDAPTPSFSTFQYFYYGENNASDLARDGTASGLLTVEMLPDIRNKRVEGHVVWQGVSKMVAPSSGFLLTDILT